MHESDQFSLTAPRMRRWLAIVAMGLIACFGSSAGAEDWINGQGVLWKVEYGGRAPSHILGTMHSANERVLDLPAAARAAFEASDTLALELVLSTPEAGYRAHAAMLQNLVLTDGRTLDQIIGAERFEQVAGILARNQVPRHISRFITPAAAYQLMHVPEQVLDADGYPVRPLDMQLEIDARDAGKRVLPLEFLREQTELFEGNDEDADVRLLLGLVDIAQRHGGLEEYFAAKTELMVDLYESEDIAAILEIGSPPLPPEERAQAADALNKILFRRNARMVQRMDPLLARGNAFIAIGAGHLPGRKGIVNMLVQRGYKVSRVE